MNKSREREREREREKGTERRAYPCAQQCDRCGQTGSTNILPVSALSK